MLEVASYISMEDAEKTSGCFNSRLRKNNFGYALPGFLGLISIK
jgi:hypothetical protein